MVFKVPGAQYIGATNNTAGCTRYTSQRKIVQGTTSRTGKNIRNKKNKERVTLQVKILEIEINVQNYMYPTYSLPLA